MNWLNAFNILAGVITIISLFYGVMVARRSDRRKILTFDSTPPLALVTVLPNQTGHRLSIVFEKEGASPINIKGAYLYFIRVVNLGKEPIKREDLATADLLRLEILNANVLDLAIASVSRQVINFCITPIRIAEESLNSSQLSFDFLDYRDGALIRILTDSPSASLELKGTIIGMPKGIAHLREAGGIHPSRKKILVLFFLIPTVSMLLGWIGEKFPSQTLVWNVVKWIFLFLSISAFVNVLSKFFLSPERRWPSTLQLPVWFTSEYFRERLSK